jgi:hypothetical protein
MDSVEVFVSDDEAKAMVNYSGLVDPTQSAEALLAAAIKSARERQARLKVVDFPVSDR